MKRSTKWFLALLALTLLAGGSLVALLSLAQGPLRVKSGSVLAIDLSGPWPEHDPNAELNELFGVRSHTMRDFLDALEIAAEDDDVAGLELRVGLPELGWGRAQEMREALLRFRASGKPVHALVEATHDGGYYVASAADDVRMIRSGTLWLDGLSAEVPFYAGTLAKVGLEADFEQIAEYKNAPDVFERRAMTEEHREAMNVLLDGLYGEIVAGLAESLQREEEEIRELISNGPYTAKQAVEAGLVDGLAFPDEARERLDERLSLSEAPRVELARYVESRARPRGRHSVAVVHCVGTIVPGRSEEGLFGGVTMGSETISKAIREAWEEDDADAIVLRVDSPGGSPLASDVIWRAVEVARDADVPVVVSMADVAASGGYWISMGADHVVAQPATITGSIGIYAGKYVTKGFNDKIDLNVEPVERGRNAGYFSTRARFTDAQRAKLRASLGEIYELFLEKVAEGRDIASPEDVHEIARGRVWTGRQALERGLVDELGGLEAAIAAAREQAGIPADEDVTLRSYPRAPSLFEALFGGGSVQLRRALARAAASSLRAEVPAPMREALEHAALLEQVRREGVTATMPYRVSAR